MSHSVRLSVLSLTLALVAACAPGAATRPPSGAVGLADPRLTATLWVQASQEHRAVHAQAYDLALLRLPAALSTPGSAALEQTDGGIGKPPAVIFDVDETVLDNSPYQARLVRQGRKGFDPAAWDVWVAERRAAPIPGAVAFVESLRARGVRAVYVTNRPCVRRASSDDPCPQKADTIANLASAGFGTVDPDDLLLTGEVAGWASDKGLRRAAVAARYRIVMQVGDQLTDFVSVPRHAPPAERAAIAAAHADLMRSRWIALPNAAYGHWLDSIPDPLAELRLE